LTGGFYAAHMSRRLPQQWVRTAVVVAGSGITVYFFWAVYLSA
jgi:hypothetical protein